MTVQVTQAKHRRLLHFLVVAVLATLFSVGCGSSRHDYTGFVPNPVPVGPTGTVVFEEFVLANPQAVEVPATTDTLAFDFYDSTSNHIYSDSQPFDTTITVDNVPVEASSVTITAYGPGGIPLASLDTTLSVVGGGTITVTLSGSSFTGVALDTLSVTPDPVELSLVTGPSQVTLALGGQFANGDIVSFTSATGATATYTSNDDNIATVSTDGTVTAVAVGSTTIDIALTLNGATTFLNGVIVTVDGAAPITGQLIVEPDELYILPPTIDPLSGPSPTPANIAVFNAYFIPPGQTERIEVTSQVGVSFDNFWPETATGDGINLVRIPGGAFLTLIDISGGSPFPTNTTIPYGATATMTVSFVYDGIAYSDEVDIVFATPKLIGVELYQGLLDEITLPADNVNDFPLRAEAVYSNGMKVPITNFDGNPATPFFTDSFTASFTTSATGLDFDGTSGVDLFFGTNGGGEGQTATLAIYANGDTDPATTLDISLIDAEVKEVALDVSNTQLDPSATYTVTLTYDDADETTLDVTSLWDQFDFSAIGIVSPSFSPFAIEYGILYGEQLGTTDFFIDDGVDINEVTSYLNNALGLPGQDTDDTNNSVTLKVLSTSL